MIFEPLDCRLAEDGRGRFIVQVYAASGVPGRFWKAPEWHDVSRAYRSRPRAERALCRKLRTLERRDATEARTPVEP
jgi:hypothetical protein